MNLLKIIVLWFGVANVVFANSDFTVNEQRELPKQLGIYRDLQFKNDVTLYAATLNAGYQSRLYLQPEKNQFDAKRLNDLADAENFVVGINGGYYLPSYLPAGLFVLQGKAIQSYKRSKLLSSCVGINRNGKMFIERFKQNCANAYYAMQTGPWLIDQNEINPDLKKMQEKPNYLESFFNRNRRTVLASSNAGELIVIVTPSATLLEVASVLKQYPQAFGVQQITQAINLDGGSSSGLFVKFDKNPFYFPELKPVKTMVFFS